MNSPRTALPAGWRPCRLESLLREVDVRVADLPVDQRDGLEVLSLTKRFGLIPQSERFERRVATENVDKYKVVRRGWIVYNPYVIWEGAIHALRRDAPGIVSPVYPIWERIEDDGGFVDLILRTPELIAAYERFSAGAVNRRRSIKKEGFLSIEIQSPPLTEQKKIAEILGQVQCAIEQQAQLAALATELRDALLRHLLTRGLQNEPLRLDPDLGPVVKTWDVVSLGSVMSEDPKNGLYKHSSVYGSGTPILRINDFSNDGDIVNSAPNRVLTDASENRLFALRKDDIVTNRVNSLSHLGNTALMGELHETMVFESNMMRFRVDERRALPRYILRVMNAPLCKRQIIGHAKRAVAQSSINQGNLKAVLIPLPSLTVQEEIVEALEAVITKMNLHERKKGSLTDMLHTMLHQMMKGQIRVRDMSL